MHGDGLLPAWIAVFMGLYAMAAGLGEWRTPGRWARMVEEIERSAATAFLAGLLCIVVGAAIFIVTEQSGGDLLAFALHIIGGLTAAEGLILLAAPDRLLGFAARLLAKGGKGWAGVSVLIGVGLFLLGAVRL